MSERKSKSSKIDSPQPGTMPVVSWDFDQRSKPGQVLHSEPNMPIMAFHGRGWEERGVMNTSRNVVPRRQMMLPKIPKVC
jgi:hypothetical protein